MVKFTEELLEETKGMGHPQHESDRLVGGGPGGEGDRTGPPMLSTAPGAL